MWTIGIFYLFVFICRVRWDKANLNDYYFASLLYLDHIDLNCRLASCPAGCDNNSHRMCLDKLYKDIVYKDIVYALQQAEAVPIPRIPVKSLKPLWNDYLWWTQRQTSFWGRLYGLTRVVLGTANSRQKLISTRKYKTAIRQAINDYDNSFDDDLYEHFVHKNSKQFWKCRYTKFSRAALSNRPLQVGGPQDSGDIAQAFADSFKNEYYNSYDDVDCMNQYSQLCNTRHQNNNSVDWNILIDSVNVELVDKIARSSKLGKASGPDGLSAEHLIYAHPKLIVLLSQ